MTSLCLFDIYRGIFTAESHRVKSSGVTSEVQAAAKLSLLNYLLHKVITQSGALTGDMRLKAFLGDLVMGIHQETVSDTKLASTDYKDEASLGLDKYMGAEEYIKLLRASKTLSVLASID